MEYSHKHNHNNVFENESDISKLWMWERHDEMTKNMKKSSVTHMYMFSIKFIVRLFQIKLKKKISFKLCFVLLQ